MEETKRGAEESGPEKKSAKAKGEKPVVRKVSRSPDSSPDAKAQEAQNRVVLESARKIAERIEARLIFLIVEDPTACKVPEDLARRKDFVLVVAEKFLDEDLIRQYKQIITLPPIQLSRMGKIKMAVMRSLAAHLLAQGDKIVCVTGSRGSSSVDSVVVLDIGKESELLSSAEIGNLRTEVRTEVFEELLTIAVELAIQGREGKSVGTLFVLGDTDKVMQLSRQMIFNPFHGYPEEERNILDPRLRDTIKEFGALDGAFVIRDDGVIMAAGRHLNAALENQAMPQGLGARHAAAAGITAVTNATAIVISESTGTVRIFRHGKIFMELEKPAGPQSR